MKKVKNILILFVLTLLLSSKAWAFSAWINDMRSLFLSKGAIIYTINIRTFNAHDKNQNGIIEEELGESRGTFINAIDRLDELSELGINTIHVLPITPVGKIKALGTAGSLYSAASFNQINPQLIDKKSNLPSIEQAKKFVLECHKRKIRVLIDLPSCASYDLYLKHPELFKLDKNQQPIVPADWTDVRLLDAGTNEQINMDVYKLYKDFIDMATSIEADGIRADVANIKPYEFWKDLISETRVRNPQFLFLAEAKPEGRETPSEQAVFTPFNKLLDAGFDGYYGSYSDLKNWKCANDLYKKIKFDIETSKKYSGEKAAIGAFATHDDISPVLVNGVQYSKMIIWLNSTLPINSYYVDGFPTGDKYVYFWGNKKASKTFTDDDYYFVHHGQLDIFNFSRKPEGSSFDILQDFMIANRFKSLAATLVSQGDFNIHKTTSSSVFAYSRTYNKNYIVVIGNLDFKKTQKVTVCVPQVRVEQTSIPIKITNIPKIKKGEIVTTLNPGEVQVLMFGTDELK